jgi:hypothetical protein
MDEWFSLIIKIVRIEGGPHTQRVKTVRIDFRRTKVNGGSLMSPEKTHTQTHTLSLGYENWAEYTKFTVYTYPKYTYGVFVHQAIGKINKHCVRKHDKHFLNINHTHHTIQIYNNNNNRPTERLCCVVAC